MELAKKSVWEIKGSDLADDNQYRIIDIMHEVDALILFPLNNLSSTARPVAVSIAAFSEQVKSKKVKSSEFELPNYLQVAEESIPKEHIIRRNGNYGLIQGIVYNREFIFDYATKKRAPQLAKYSRELGVDRKTLARLLTQFWRNGQDIMALLPAFSQSGGLGKEKKTADKPLGAPRKPRTVAVERADKYIVSSIDKNKFKKALKKYYLNASGLTLAKTYKHMLKDSYAEEIRLADACEKAPFIPTLKQFTYWKKKLFNEDVIIKRRTTENDYLRNKRGLLGSVSQASHLPGTFFEIDATVADVHIVSELGSEYALGRPTIYIVVDRASRMIVGMHVSLYHASWRAARQALVNCFLPKSRYCKEYGIDINDSEWPCAHIPKELVCDNGEMIGLQPQDALTPMTKLSFTPPYRPDRKGVVEKRFDIINKESIHDLLGTTRGGQVVRGSRDPRKDAIYTLKEVTVEIIRSVLEHNRSILNDLAFSSPLLIANDLSPTPLNYWKIHLAKHKHELQVASSEDVISRLLPPAEASMTRNGIHYNGLYYSCSEVEKYDLASIARSSGQWRLEARIDENTTNHIFVRFEKNKGFTECFLLPRSRMFRDKLMAEADFIQDWLDSKKELAPISIPSIDDHYSRQQVTKGAKKRSKESKQMTFSEKTKNVRQNRTDELSATTNMIASDNYSQGASSVPDSSPVGEKVIPLPVGRKRKAKGDDS